MRGGIKIARNNTLLKKLIFIATALKSTIFNYFFAHMLINIQVFFYFSNNFVLSNDNKENPLVALMIG